MSRTLTSTTTYGFPSCSLVVLIFTANLMHLQQPWVCVCGENFRKPSHRLWPLGVSVWFSLLPGLPQGEQGANYQAPLPHCLVTFRLP